MPAPAALTAGRALPLAEHRLDWHTSQVVGILLWWIQWGLGPWPSGEPYLPFSFLQDAWCPSYWSEEYRAILILINQCLGAQSSLRFDPWRSKEHHFRYGHHRTCAVLPFVPEYSVVLYKTKVCSGLQFSLGLGHWPSQEYYLYLFQSQEASSLRFWSDIQNDFVPDEVCSGLRPSVGIWLWLEHYLCFSSLKYEWNTSFWPGIQCSI